MLLPQASAAPDNSLLSRVRSPPVAPALGGPLSHSSSAVTPPTPPAHSAPCTPAAPLAVAPATLLLPTLHLLVAPHTRPAAAHHLPLHAPPPLLPARHRYASTPLLSRP